MSGFDSLLRLAGAWKGTYRLRVTSRAEEQSPSAALAVPVIGSRFFRIDYTWATQGEPQAGSLLFGCEAKGGVATAAWIDSWHMGDKIMICRGRVKPSGVIDVFGTYAVPAHHDWGWRTLIVPGTRSFRLKMYDVSPRGKEEPAVDVKYARAPRSTESPWIEGRRTR
jgi:hypothetical protein